jgi:membrane protease YdiL (CAAX protease family)
VLVVAAALSIALAVWLVLVQPFLGRKRYRRLVDRITRDSGARLHHYRRGIATEWTGAALVGIIALLAHDRVRSLWPPGSNTKAVAQVPLLIGLVILGTYAYRVGGERSRKLVALQLRNVSAILPRTRTERFTFAGLAVTAGVCEELVYRGFGLFALRWAVPGISEPALIVLTGAAFGLAHLYQGPPGVAATGLVGGYFAWLVISTGTLVPVMLLHAVVDLRILALPLDAVPFPSTAGISDRGPDAAGRGEKGPGA